jgi:hypothetical protein
MADKLTGICIETVTREILLERSQEKHRGRVRYLFIQSMQYPVVG